MKKIKLFLQNLLQRKRLFIYLDEDNLSLALSSKGKILKTDQIFLRETSQELVREKVAAFFQEINYASSLLILPRSEVLQKELLFSSSERSHFKEVLDTKLETLLPYARKEMAYGMSFEVNGDSIEGLILALPEKYLKEKLGFLEKAGLYPDEIVTEDQALLWLKGLNGGKDPFLLIDSDPNRILFVCGRKNELLFSRAFSRKDSEDLHLEEISLTLLEKNLKLEKLFLTHSLSDQVQNEIGPYFNCPVGKIGNGELPVWEGALSFGTYHYLSLLPEQEKIKRKTKEKRKLFLEAIGSFSFFFTGLLIAFALHLQFESIQLKKLDGELTKLLPGVKQVKEIRSSIDLLGQAQGSKIKLLELLKELALKLPSQVTIKELSFGPKDFFFKGESSSHGFISETVDMFSHVPFLTEVKLGETRLKKKLSEDYFEFEVTAKWIS